MRGGAGPTVNSINQRMKRVRANVFERNEKKWIAMIVLITVGLIDLSAGILYRVVYGYPWAEHGLRIGQLRDRELRESSPIFHHGFRRNRSVKDARWGNRAYEVTTDSLGFKNRSMKTVDLTSEKHRVLFIGDSFTEGVGVAYPNTFVGIVESKLSSEGIEVLNAAATSYSPIIYWRKIKFLLEEVGLRFDEVVVYIDISDAHDEATRYELGDNGSVVDRTSPRTPSRTPSQQPRSLTSSIRSAGKNNSILLYSIYNACIQAIRKVLGGAQQVDYLNERNLWTVDQKLFREWGNNGLDNMTIYMGKLLTLLRKNEIRLTVAVYPHPHQILHNDVNSIQVTHWKSWCERNGVDFINHFPSFFVPSKRKEETIQLYFIEGDVHWNERGHHLIAESFLAFRKQQAP